MARKRCLRFSGQAGVLFTTRVVNVPQDASGFKLPYGPPIGELAGINMVSTAAYAPKRWSFSGGFAYGI